MNFHEKKTERKAAMINHDYDRYGITKLPFYNPPEKLFHDKNRERAFTHLDHFIQHRGFCVITGNPGIGKSIFMRKFCNSLHPKKAKILYIPFSMFAEFDMLCSLCYQLELETSFMKSHMLKRIRERIQELQPVNIIAVFDEVQKIKHSALEIIRTMTNFDFDEKSYVSVILSGTPEFLNILRLKINEHLKQRISLFVSLETLSRNDTSCYIKNYMKDAGVHRDIFTEQAINTIYELTDGIPRMINNICASAFAEAATNNSELIEINHVQLANQNLTLPIKDIQK